MRILAIDDEPIFCDLLRARLEQLGYQNVETAFTGPEALDIAAARTNPVECFIVDIRMMPMDGIELVRRLRAIPHHQATPIVMLSALTDKASIDAAFMAGANDYITKPLEMVELKIRLEMARNIQAERAQARLLHEHVLKQEAILFPSAEFGGEIILDDVPGAVSVMSMENFLLKQGNIRLRQSSAIGFSLQQADRYFQKMDPTYYAVLIGDMAQAVSRALSAFPHMLTCPGNGDIVALLVDRAHVDIDQIKENLAHELEALRLRFSAIDMTLPQLETGAPVRTGLFRTHCPTTLIARARAAARGSEGTRAAHNLQAIA
ncbi:response regulator [Roseovarius sp. SK2]|jgi:CheY-like chemotaxis protein|uniref:response regulator transcription factor n=1 Tax=Roseovarius TaxID=74030 RepID=UPI000CDD89FF|nr:MULTISPECIES: response regulator [Roseovarius]MDD9728001.1 response regulator [Roseovarius sp. SK2]